MAANLHLDHVAIPIFEVEASYEFYHRVLGLSLLDALSGDDWGGKPWLMMIFGLSDDRQLALCALRGAANAPESELPDDVRHFAFACESHQDLATWKDRLARHGVEFSEEDHGDQRSVYFKDPNGVVLEVTTPRDVPPAPAADGEATIRAWCATPRKPPARR